MNCTSDIKWVDDFPCKPQDWDYYFKKSLEKMEKQQAEEKRLKAEAKKLKSEIAARVVKCKKCNCRVPQSDLMITVDTCEKCADINLLIHRIATIATLIVIINLLIIVAAKNQSLIFISVDIAVLTVITALIIGSRAKNKHKHFVEAKAKAEQLAAEAKAKAEQLAAEAKAKAEQLAAEEMAKLSDEIGAGRVGAKLDIKLTEKTIISFAFCPAGSFTMGSPETEENRFDDEDQVQVTLTKAFWMAKTEITQSQWCAVMILNPNYISFKGSNLPVEHVSWNAAQKFIKKVNDSGVIPEGWKLALPTEAQWEYACRAGETGPYSGGTIKQVAWYKRNSADITKDVGTKKPNAWGIHDMHGNVREWCADWYAEDLSGGSDPSGPSTGVNRVYRGGCWSCDAAFCRAATRGGQKPDSGYATGFRPVLVPSE